VQAAKKALAEANAGQLRASLVTQGTARLELVGGAIELGPDDIEVVVDAAEGYAAAGDRVGVVVLHTTLDDQLLDEGLERECLSRIQAIRKELALDYTTRIRIAVDGSERIRRVVSAASARLSREVLATELSIGAASFSPVAATEADLDGDPLVIAVGLASKSCSG
jgi:isoleucyl-tRNA synthetase